MMSGTWWRNQLMFPLAMRDQMRKKLKWFLKIIIIIIVLLLVIPTVMKNERKKKETPQLDIDNELEVTLKATLNPRVVKAIKNLQASFNENANKIMQQAGHEKAAKKNLIFFIHLATIGIVAKDKITTKEEPHVFDKACTILMRNNGENGERHCHDQAASRAEDVEV